MAGGNWNYIFLTFLEYMIDKNLNSNIKLYFGINSEKLILFDKLIAECEINIKHFKKNLFIENNTVNITNFRNSKLDIEKILDEVKDRGNVNFYLSDPLEIVKKFKNFLINIKINIQKVHRGEWE